MRLFKSKLRSRIETKVADLEVRVDLLREELKGRNIKRSIDPVKYAKYFIKIKDLDEKIKMLKELL